jgi:GT2 family glycosyltransferase
MISVISRYSTDAHQALLKRNVAKTIGAEHEFIPLRGNGIAALYNRAAAGARGSPIVFLDDDCYFLKENWGAALEGKFRADGHLGVAGVAGTQYLFADKYSWTASGRPFTRGRILYHLQNDDFFAVVFSVDTSDAEVVACDGSFMAVRPDLFAKIKFDDNVFPGEYFYDIDFCLQARRFSKIIVTPDVVIKRRNQAVFGDSWRRDGEAFLRKNRGLLPASCAGSVPDAAHAVPSQIVDLKGRMSPTVLC